MLNISLISLKAHEDDEHLFGGGISDQFNKKEFVKYQASSIEDLKRLFSYEKEVLNWIYKFRKNVEAMQILSQELLKRKVKQITGDSNGISLITESIQAKTEYFPQVG